MTFASDQDSSSERLSATSRRMLALRDEVFTAWEAEVRALPEAGPIRRPILINTLPAFYDNIAQAITASYPRQTGSDGASLAAEHGGERARMTDYSHQALIGEYQIFRWAIFNVLEKHRVHLEHAEYVTINASIDAGIREAVDGYTLVHAALRERFAAALTHDMRTPLGIAVSALEISLRTLDADRARAMTTKALENLQRMDVMISELLHSMAFAGGHSMQLAHTCFDVQELLTEVQADAMAIHGSRLRVEGRSVRGWWGRPELKRAIENMVGNAFKYGDPQGPVKVLVNEAYGRLLLSVHNEGGRSRSRNRRRFSGCTTGPKTPRGGAPRGGASACLLCAPWPRAMAGASGSTVRRNAARPSALIFPSTRGPVA